MIGDPTEVALLVVAAKGGMTRRGIEAELPRLETLPFDSDRKRMTVIALSGQDDPGRSSKAPQR